MLCSSCLSHAQVQRLATQIRHKVNRDRIRVDPSKRLPKLPNFSSRTGKSKLKGAEERRKLGSERYSTMQKLWKLGIPSKGRQTTMLRQAAQKPIVPLCQCSKILHDVGTYHKLLAADCA